MKSGGFKHSNARLKNKSPSDVPEGISRTRLGDLRVRDPGYLQALHESREPVLEIGSGLEKTGKLDLHHGVNPVKHSRRTHNDASVVPLDANDHLNFIEASAQEEKALQRVFSCFAAFRYWAYHHNRQGTTEDALAFQLWVLEKMEAECPEPPQD